MASLEKRISKDGDISYRAKVRLKGYSPESATFERLTDAKKWVQSTESAMKENRYFKTSEAKKRTLGELIDRYIKDILPRKPKSQEVQKTQLLWWKGEIGYKSLSDVTTSILIECRSKLLNEPNIRNKYRTPATVNRYMAALSHTFTIACKELEWMENNPIMKISKAKEPRGRVRFLSDSERKALLAECQASSNHYLYTIVVLALSTGARRNELLKLKWQDITIKSGQGTIQESKNGERRSLPVKGLALQLLQEQSKVRNLHCDYVFASPNKCQPIDIRSAWDTAIKNAGIDDFRFHDLRHSAASYLAMNGASLAEIAEVLGHKTLQMVKRYAHLSEAHTASVVERMNNKIFG